MMKHRSIVIFVIVVSILAVAPQAAQQLDELRKNAASQVEGAIFNAFLNLQAQKQRGRETARREMPAAAITTAALPSPACTQQMADASAASRSKTTATTNRAGIEQRHAPPPARHARKPHATDSASNTMAHNHLKGFDVRFDFQQQQSQRTKIAPRVELDKQVASRPVFIDRETKTARVQATTEAELARALSLLKALENRKEARFGFTQIVERRQRQGSAKGGARRTSEEEFELLQSEEQDGVPHMNVLKSKAHGKRVGAPARPEAAPRPAVFPPVAAT